MQLILLIVFFIVALALVCWGILKGNSFVRILAALSAIILACYVSFGFVLASSWVALEYIRAHLFTGWGWAMLG